MMIHFVLPQFRNIKEYQKEYHKYLSPEGVHIAKLCDSKNIFPDLPFDYENDKYYDINLDNVDKKLSIFNESLNAELKKYLEFLSLQINKCTENLEVSNYREETITSTLVTPSPTSLPTPKFTAQRIQMPFVIHQVRQGLKKAEDLKIVFSDTEKESIFEESYLDNLLIQAVYFDSNNPNHIKAIEENHEEIEKMIKFLVEKGANVTTYDGTYSVLMYASKSGLTDSVRLLLEYGAVVGPDENLFVNKYLHDDSINFNWENTQSSSCCLQPVQKFMVTLILELMIS